MGDQDLTQELPGFILLLECLLELSLRDEEHLNENLTQQPTRLLLYTHHAPIFGIAVDDL